jgi:alkanesulfonate monooxygenase SsuD/methylene tetrahydromethanopterin reductase-like flavin-dependent oxidoreductase (luciferase family)
VQQPHPPFWIGGNSRRARERVAAVGDAWMPLQIDAAKAATVRTSALATVDALGDGIDDLRRRVAAAGRDPSTIDVQVEGAESQVLRKGGPLDAHRSQLARLEAVGVTWFVVDPPSDSLTGAIRGLERYGKEVIAALGRPD